MPPNYSFRLISVIHSPEPEREQPPTPATSRGMLPVLNGRFTLETDRSLAEFAADGLEGPLLLAARIHVDP